VLCPIALNELQYLCMNISANNVSVYLSDGARFRKVAEATTNLTPGAAFNQTPLKLATIGRTYRNQQTGGVPDGCPMDLHSFYWNDGITTRAERAIFHDVFKSGADANLAGPPRSCKTFS
jgi:hypothetical protein